METMMMEIVVSIIEKAGRLRNAVANLELLSIGFMDESLVELLYFCNAPMAKLQVIYGWLSVSRKVYGMVVVGVANFLYPSPKVNVWGLWPPDSITKFV